MSDPAERLREAIRAVQEITDEILARDRRRNYPARILLVDDDQDDVCALCRELRNFICDVQVCRDPIEAKEKLVTDKFDFVFLDQKMPKLTGLEILSASLPGNSSTQFFIVSGFQDSAIVSETLRSGALYLPKPVTRKLLATFLQAKL